MPSMLTIERVLRAISRFRRSTTARTWQRLFEGARLRAERALARPVTHAVIALAVAAAPADRRASRPAAEAAGLMLRLSRRDRRPDRRAACAAAIRAEDLAPRPAGRNGSLACPRWSSSSATARSREVDAPLGLSVLEIAHKNDVDIEGACEGSLACSTCHVIVDPEWYELLKDASEDEEDMLDLAFGLTATSRLGCQIVITEELDGLVVRLPASTRNLLRG